MKATYIAFRFEKCRRRRIRIRRTPPHWFGVTILQDALHDHPTTVQRKMRNRFDFHPRAQRDLHHMRGNRPRVCFWYSPNMQVLQATACPRVLLRGGGRIDRKQHPET